MLRESLASALRKTQESRGMTEQELAALLQLPCATVRAALQGRADLPIGTVEQIAGRLSLNPADLVSNFHGEQAQTEALAYLLQSFVDLPLSNRLELAKALLEISALLDAGTGKVCSCAPAKRREQKAETK